LAELKYIDFTYCELSNIEPIASLQNLVSVNFSYNNISSIEPLMNIPNLQTLLLAENPLSNDAINIQILELESRGISVHY